jgi:hypothetical protein
MDWRTEDSVYATASLMGIATVGYLVAANFGLVPSLGESGLLGDIPRVDTVVAEGGASAVAFPPLVAAAPVPSVGAPAGEDDAPPSGREVPDTVAPPATNSAPADPKEPVPTAGVTPRVPAAHRLPAVTAHRSHGPAFHPPGHPWHRPWGCRACRAGGSSKD